jgi:predicted nucleic acid-binding protein
MSFQAFWDASILVPLCVNEPNTVKAERLLGRNTVIVWWGTPIEIVSAFGRLRRMGTMTDLELTKSEAELHRMRRDWRVVQPSEEVLARALLVVKQYALRAGDAMQLAAALAWCESQPAGEIFLTADRRLAEAAEDAGFTLEPGLAQA